MRSWRTCGSLTFWCRKSRQAVLVGALRSRELSEARQPDPERLDLLAHARVGQRFELDLPFVPVHRGQPLGVAGMAADLRLAFAGLVAQDPDQELGADVLQIGHAPLPLAVEPADVAFVGGFYGQWEWGVTDLEHVSSEFLIWILRNEAGEG